MNYIKGKYVKNIFSSDKGYIIGILIIDETDDENLSDFIGDEMTFTGYFADLKVNEKYTLYGEVVDHVKYGIQFSVDSYEKVTPKDKDGIVEFLSSSLFSGVGEKMASRIVKTLGENTIELILEDKNNLLKVPRLSTKKIDLIYDTLITYNESEKTIIYLNNLGFNMRDSLLIYNRYKDLTLMMVDNNLYSLVDDIEEINFAKIDEIYLKQNKELDNAKRIEACIIYVMQQIVFKNSDAFLYFEEIKEGVFNYLGFEVSNLEYYIDNLRFQNKIVLEEGCYYLEPMYNDEVEIANKISTLLRKDMKKNKKLLNYLEEIENYNNITYSAKQREAIIKALENNIVIITGGPGTGKTTIIDAIVKMYQNYHNLGYEALQEELVLLAPTGRASKRMSEATNYPASTIHRYLKWNKESNSFQVNELNKNKHKFLVIDEVSMIDNYLLASLFRGITDDVQIVLVGDYNQLPSVGPGQVLKDLIESDLIDVIKLDLLYRQSLDSYISVLASKIIDDDLNDISLKENDFLFLKCSSESIRNNIIKISKQLKEKDYDYKNFQLLAPMYAGINGIDNLNKELQKIFNPEDKKKKELKVGSIIYRENDKVLQLSNMADYNVFNGDVGIIREIVMASDSESGKNEIVIDYDGNILRLLPKDFNAIKHGFIISIHKSQGSEFDTVVMPVCHSYHRMLYKKLIYTGITRAKKRLIILGEYDSFIKALENNKEIIRKSNLKDKLMYKLTKNI